MGCGSGLAGSKAAHVGSPGAHAACASAPSLRGFDAPLHPPCTLIAPLAPAGPDAFWYNSTRTPSLLRFEDAPRPGRTLQFKRIPGKGLPPPFPHGLESPCLCWLCWPALPCAAAGCCLAVRCRLFGYWCQPAARDCETVPTLCPLLCCSGQGDSGGRLCWHGVHQPGLLSCRLHGECAA